MASLADGEQPSNLVVRKCRKLWRRLKLFNNNNNCRPRNNSNKGGEVQQEQLTCAEERAERHGDDDGMQQHPMKQSDERNTLSMPTRPRRRLPSELLAELCDCVPHHRLGLAKLVTSYSSCPVGLFGVHLTAQNGLPSAQLFHVCSLLTNLLRKRHEKMVGPINKWNENELEMYNKWKAESVHLITLLEEVKRLHASQ